MGLKVALIALVGIVLLAAAGIWWGSRKWETSTSRLSGRLLAHQPAQLAVYSETELEGLPAPVVRYFRKVLKPGQAIVRHARITWAGEFNMGEPGRDNWRSFTAVQDFVPAAPGFVWNARISMMPGVPVLVRDAFVDGAGHMQGAVFGLVSVVNQQGTPTLASGALQRYLGEAAWFPTALLPSQGVQWTAIDDSRALAALTVGGTAVSLEFRFNADGLNASVFTPSRFYDDGSNPPVARPWQARSLRFGEHAGMIVPDEAVVEWLLPEGVFAYWRGRTMKIVVE